MGDVERYGEFRGRLQATIAAAMTMQTLLGCMAVQKLPPPDDVSGPEAGECVALWGLGCDYQFTVVTNGNGSISWDDLRPDRVESGSASQPSVVYDRLASNVKAKEAAGG